jgi:hypothetical protein
MCPASGAPQALEPALAKIYNLPLFCKLLQQKCFTINIFNSNKELGLGHVLIHKSRSLLLLCTNIYRGHYTPGHRYGTMNKILFMFIFCNSCFCYREERAVWRGASPLVTAQITSGRFKSGATTTPVRPGFVS